MTIASKTNLLRMVFRNGRWVRSFLPSDHLKLVSSLYSSAPAFLTATSRLCRPCRSPQSLHSDFEQEVTEKTELHLCYLCLLLLSLWLSFVKLQGQSSDKRLSAISFPSQSRATGYAPCNS